MKANYAYPLDPTWSTDEMTTVLHFFNQVEDYYETSGVNRETFMAAYRAFKTVVPSKMQEKQLDKQFQDDSGYSTYRAVQAVSKSDREKVKYVG
jgi:uncharacterized protein YktA (UPF0223 family)